MENLIGFLWTVYITSCSYTYKHIILEAPYMVRRFASNNGIFMSRTTWIYLNINNKSRFYVFFAWCIYVCRFYLQITNDCLILRSHCFHSSRVEVWKLFVWIFKDNCMDKLTSRNFPLLCFPILSIDKLNIR